jgi:uncharacterized protein DUF5670
MLKNLLITIAVILAVIWIIALLAKVTVWAIHLLIVAAVILLIAHFVLGNRAV